MYVCMCVDVCVYIENLLSQDGYVFRVRIHYPRELALMRELSGKLSCGEAEVLHQRVLVMERREVFLPLHTSTLNGLVVLHEIIPPGMMHYWVGVFIGM